MKATLFAGFLFAFGLAEKYAKKSSYDNVVLKKFPDADLDELYRSSGRFKAAKKA